MKVLAQPIIPLSILQTHFPSNLLVSMIEIIITYWVKALATLVVFSILIVLFLRSSNEKSGISGAALVEKELGQLGENYKVFKDLVVQSERGVSHIHYIVVSSHGVYVVTRCDLVGKISGDKNNREWEIKAKGVSDTLLNPLWENRKHINALEKKLNLTLSFVPVVVFTYAKLVNDFGPTAVYLSQLQKIFAGQTRMQLSQVDQESIIAILKE